MDGKKVDDLSTEEVLSVTGAQGQAAFAGLGQLIRELEPTIGIDAAERVRAKAMEALKASGLRPEIEQAFARRLD